MTDAPDDKTYRDESGVDERHARERRTGHAQDGAARRRLADADVASSGSTSRRGSRTRLPPLAARFDVLRNVAAGAAPVLVLGESGTGKERVVVPVGASSPIPVDIRVVAATHQPIRNLVETGAYHRGLFARLSGLEITLPPLRERIEDLGVIVASLAPTATLGASVARTLARHPWPLNIRERQQAFALATTLATGSVLDLPMLPPGVASHGARHAASRRRASKCRRRRPSP